MTHNQRVPSSSLGRRTPPDLGVLVITRATAASWGSGIGPDRGGRRCVPKRARIHSSRSRGLWLTSIFASHGRRRGAGRRAEPAPHPRRGPLLADPGHRGQPRGDIQLDRQPLAEQDVRGVRLVARPTARLSSGQSASFHWPRPRWNATHPIPILPFPNASAEILRPSPPQRPRT